MKRKNITKKTYKALMSNYTNLLDLIKDNRRLYNYLNRISKVSGYSIFNEFEDIRNIPNTEKEIVKVVLSKYPSYKSFVEDEDRAFYELYSTKLCIIIENENK